MAAAISLCACEEPAESHEGRTNVLIISIDTLRADHLSCYGYGRSTSPHIDRLAAQGHRFGNTFTTMPTTLPAHASLFTSLYPTQNSTQRNGEKVPADATTLAELLQASGYSTAAFVSTTVLDARYGIDQGFETYGDVGEFRKLPAETTLAKAREWLGAHEASEPFFLFVHFYDPHAPYEAPESFRRRMQAPDEPRPLGPKWVVEPELITPEYVAATTAAYDAEIAYSDWAVGELMADLNRRGLDDRTLVVLLADHGETLDELFPRYGYAFGHGQFLYVHQIQIPLIFRMPGFESRKGGAVHEQSVSIVDVAPTILDILGIDSPEGIEGRSLVPLLDGKTLPTKPVFAERRVYEDSAKPFLEGRDYAIVDGRRHYILSTARPDELYDLDEDPGEAIDLGEEHPTAESLEKTINAWLEHLEPRYGPPERDTDPATLERLRSLGYVD